MIWVSCKDCDAPLKTFLLSSTYLFSRVLLLFVAFPFLVLSLFLYYHSPLSFVFFFSYFWCSFFLFFLAPLTWVLKASFIGKDRRMVAFFHNHSSQLTLLPCPSCKLVEGTCTSFSQFWLIWVVFFVVFCKFLGVRNRREKGCN
jgi:hypothetical protein